MSEPQNRRKRVEAWLLLWVTAGLACAPTDNVVGAVRGGQLSGDAAGSGGARAGGGESAGAIASGGMGNSQGGTADSVPPGRSGAGGIGASQQTNAGAAGLGGPSGGMGGLLPLGPITQSSFRPVVGYVTGANPRSLALDDLDNDGHADLVVVNADDNDVSVMLGYDGGFDSQGDYPTAAQTGWVALGDLNADGTLDIALASLQSNSLQVLPGVGDGSFGPTIESPRIPGTSSLVLKDVDNDHHLDVVAAPGGNLLEPAPSESRFVTVLLGDGRGKFAEPKYVAEGGDCLSVALADVNHDGNLDLARLNSRSDTVSLLLGNGDGSFTPSKEYATGTTPVFVTFADLDNDGNFDLLTVDSASNEVSVLLGSAGGDFAPRVAYQTGANPQHLTVADLNGDQKLDLLTANVSDFGVSVLQGLGDGSFATKVDYSAASDPADRVVPRATAVGDFNHDGAPDFAVVIARSSGTLPNAVLIFIALK